jgi:hypothetical protein
VNDTQRLDALNDYGLCLATHDTLQHGTWTRVWVVQYSDRVMLAPTIREAIDAAVLDITAQGLTRN